MGTLVQSPDLVQATVTGAQTAAKPVERGLGSFLSDLIPVGQELVDKHVADNAAHLRALGQNDVLNDKFSEVSYLGRKSYAEGRTYQTVVNSRAVLTQDFQAKVNASDDPEEWSQYIKEYSDATIQNIKEADLHNEVKTKLYEAQLQNNATYMSMIEKRTAKLTKDQAYETRQVDNATLLDDLQNNPMDAADTVLAIQAHRTRSIERDQNANPDKSLADSHKEWQQDVVAGTDVLFDGLKAKNDEASIKRLNMFAAVMEELPFEGLDVAKRWKQEATSFSEEFIDQQFTLAMGMVEEAGYKVRMNPFALKHNELEELREMFQTSGLYSPEQKLQATKALNTIHYNLQDALHKNQKGAIPNVRQMTRRDAIARGLSQSDVLDQAEREWVLEDWRTAGFRMMEQYGTRGELWNEGFARGARLAVDTFLPYMNLTDKDVAENVYDGHHSESFEVFRMMYNNAAASNSYLANEMLAKIPDEQREVFITSMESGHSLEWVRRQMKNLETTKAEYAAVEKAGTNLKLEDVGIGGGILKRQFNNNGGMGDSAQQAYLAASKRIAGQDVNQHVKSTNTESPKQVGTLLQKQNITSSRGLSPIQMNYKAYTLWDGIENRVGSPISKQYVGMVGDETRVREAEARGLDPDDTVSYFDETGGYLVIEYHTKDGFFKGDGSRDEILRYDSQDIAKRARELYERDKKRRDSPTPQQVKARDTVREVGDITVNDRVTGRPIKTPITVAMSKNFGENANITKRVLGDLEYWYGFASTPIEQDNGTTAIGLGYDSAMLPAGAIEKLKKAGSNPEDSPQERSKRIMEAQVDVMSTNMRSIGLYPTFKKIGIPLPSPDMYPRQHERTMSTVLTAAILYGKEGVLGDKRKGVTGVVDVFTAPTQREAVLRFNKSKLNSLKNTKRNKYYLDVIKQHYTQRGIK